MNDKITAALLVAGAVVVNVAFVGLGDVFDYPAVLDQPTGHVLAEFRAHQGAVSAWFVLLAMGAGLLAPIAWRVGVAKWVGIAAAAVQVVGLSRWPLLVPSLAADGSPRAQDTFDLLNLVMGRALGETAGYVLTAVWTVLVVRSATGGLFRVLGTVAAGLIAVGVLAPWQVPGPRCSTSRATCCGASGWWCSRRGSPARGSRQEGPARPCGLVERVVDEGLVRADVVEGEPVGLAVGHVVDRHVRPCRAVEFLTSALLVALPGAWLSRSRGRPGTASPAASAPARATTRRSAPPTRRRRSGRAWPGSSRSRRSARW